jgi:hypothetical protein
MLGLKAVDKFGDQINLFVAQDLVFTERRHNGIWIGSR